MALIWANVGELKAMDNMTGKGTPENLTLKLFKTNVTPSASSVAGDFTEADFTGYSAKTLTTTSWVSASTVSGKASTSYATQSWTAGSSQTVYGFFCVGATSGVLYFAQLFDSSVALTSGVSLSVAITLTANSEN